jgi:Na+/H+-dicarboxylate symporter
MHLSERRAPRLSLSTQVLLGLVLGIATGLFFGEGAAVVQIVGDAFIRLLQMVVIPFIAVSLIAGIGKLEYREARDLALKGGGVLLVLWGIALAFVASLPLAFPEWESASFFSASLVAEREAFDFLGLYIPRNPLFSMAHDVVPAVVVFSMAVGVALIGVERKEGLLGGLDAVGDALTRVTGFVARLAPIGVFALTASAAGTMGLEELKRLQVYLVTYAAATMLLGFWILPGLVAAVTPLRWGDVVRPTRDATVTAFATGNLLVVLPFLTEASREIAAARAENPEEMASTVEVVVPASFTFPSAGKVLTLGFLPFGAWFVGSSIPAADYPAFLVTGLFSFFGQTVTAVPFLLDFLKLPADLFQVFVTVDVIASRFGVALAAMNTVCLALLGAFAIAGELRVRSLPVLRFAGVSVAATVAVLLGLRVFYGQVLDFDTQTYEQFVEMDLAGKPQPAKLVTKEPPAPTGTLGGSRLERIRDSGRLRVCYFPDTLPFAFVNAASRLVGFDVEMAHALARELEVRLEFVRVERKRVAAHVNGGTCDLAMSGLAVTTERAREVAFSTPYMDNTLAFMVPDHRRHEFTTWERLRERRDLRIAAPPVPYYLAIVRERLPDAELVMVDSYRPLLREKDPDFDGLLYSAEAGSAWTLVYPAYAVVVPEPGRVKVPLAYAIPLGDAALVNFVDTWVDLKQKDGTIAALFEHWILGQAAKDKKPRWSVLRDVLHWGDPRAESDAPL